MIFFRGRLAEIVKLVKAGDVAALKASRSIPTRHRRTPWLGIAIWRFRRSGLLNDIDGLGKTRHACDMGSMASSDDDYVYDEATGEWRPASELAAEVAAANEVRDASGNPLADGDSVVLIKNLKVKGAGQTLKQGTVIKSIRLTDNAEEIDCRHDAIKGLVLRTEFVRKR